VSQRSHADRRA
jgi:integrase